MNCHIELWNLYIAATWIWWVSSFVPANGMLVLPSMDIERLMLTIENRRQSRLNDLVQYARISSYGCPEWYA
jgi:hypothetical protein